MTLILISSTSFFNVSYAIVAASVSFENNSILGLSNVLLNLFDDKKELAKQYNIPLDKIYWPSNFIPQQIKCDRGSDFASDIFESMCKQWFVRTQYKQILSKKQKIIKF